MRKKDKEDINHEEEMANSLNKYKMNDQTLKLVKEAKRDSSTPSGKIESQNSTTDSYAQPHHRASFRYGSSIGWPEAWAEEFDNQSNL